MKPEYQVAVIVVGFKNTQDIVGCLRALLLAQLRPSFEVFIAENGGPQAYDALVAALAATASGVTAPVGGAILSRGAERQCVAQLVREDGTTGPVAHVAEMPNNLGYAGAVNAWLRPLLETRGWKGVWVLNPDTEPQPDALAELVDYAARRGKGLVGSRLTLMSDPEHIQSRGLAWRKLRASTLAVDVRALSAEEPQQDDVERRLDAPSGASVYATRELIERIGLMHERYFLYFEDLDWGCRAKKIGAVGYAHRAVVFHKGGTTIGTAAKWSERSRLSVYLEARNRILFVRENFPIWLPWTIAMQFLYAALFASVGAFANMIAALRGIAAGVSGEVGRPKDMINPTPRAGDA